jgi:hypothetical protein
MRERSSQSCSGLGCPIVGSVDSEPLVPAVLELGHIALLDSAHGPASHIDYQGPTGRRPEGLVLRLMDTTRE